MGERNTGMRLRPRIRGSFLIAIRNSEESMTREETVTLFDYCIDKPAFQEKRDLVLSVLDLSHVK